MSKEPGTVCGNCSGLQSGAVYILRLLLEALLYLKL